MAHSIAELQRIVEDLRKRDEARNGPRRPAPHPARVRPLTEEEAAILARMQTPAARAAIEKAFHASTEDLATAAVVAATRKRG